MRRPLIGYLLRAVLIAAIGGGTFSASGKDFYVDPQHGDPANDGSKDRPWRSLQEVFAQGLIESQKWPSLPYRAGFQLVERNPGAPVRAGDTIYLRSGNYGELVIQGYYNRDLITIAAEPGHQPHFTRIRIVAGCRWVLKGLHVHPDGEPASRPGVLVDIQSHGWQGPVHDVVVEDCRLFSAEDSASWSAEQWNERAWDGIRADGERIVIRRNYLKNVNFGISVSGPHALVEHNVVENFAGDGLRGLGDYGVFQYNLVKNCYDVNQNHDDGFQSWTVGPEGVGSGQVKGVVLRGNVIINYEDPNQPHRGALQGIGCFDGMFVDWVVENNVVIVDHYHGITLGGAVGCRIVNNTVVDPRAGRPGPAAVRIGPHKKGTLSRQCVVRNNLASALDVRGEEMIVDHNVIVDEPARFFRNLAVADLHLLRGCPAIDVGTAEFAPSTDIEGTARPQGAQVDVGAYEYAADRN